MKRKKRIISLILISVLTLILVLPADSIFAKKDPEKREGVKIELTGGDGKKYEPGSTIPLWALKDATYRLIDVEQDRAWLSVVFVSALHNFSIVYQNDMGWGWGYGDLSADENNELLLNKISKNRFLKNYTRIDPLVNPDPVDVLHWLDERIPVFVERETYSFDNYCDGLIKDNLEYLTIGTQPTKKATDKWPNKKKQKKGKTAIENYIYENFYKIDLTQRESPYNTTPNIYDEETDYNNPLFADSILSQDL